MCHAETSSVLKVTLQRRVVSRSVPQLRAQPLPSTGTVVQLVQYSQRSLNSWFVESSKRRLALTAPLLPHDARLLSAPLPGKTEIIQFLPCVRTKAAARADILHLLVQSLRLRFAVRSSTLKNLPRKAREQAAQPQLSRGAGAVSVSVATKFSACTAFALVTFLKILCLHQSDLIIVVPSSRLIKILDSQRR